MACLLTFDGEAGAAWARLPFFVARVAESDDAAGEGDSVLAKVVVQRPSPAQVHVPPRRAGSEAAGRYPKRDVFSDKISIDLRVESERKGRTSIHMRGKARGALTTSNCLIRSG